jgi:hypothetical protein
MVARFSASDPIDRFLADPNVLNFEMGRSLSLNRAPTILEIFIRGNQRIFGREFALLKLMIMSEVNSKISRTALLADSCYICSRSMITVEINMIVKSAKALNIAKVQYKMEFGRFRLGSPSHIQM